MSNSTERVSAVIKAALALDKALAKRNPEGYADDAVWDEIEKKENRMLRAVEKLAGLKRERLGVKDSG